MKGGRNSCIDLGFGRHKEVLLMQLGSTGLYSATITESKATHQALLLLKAIEATWGEGVCFIQ